ncbi:hypothetical protein [Actinokineospora diospyrosa]|uniref:Complex I intermediate-associated protein 30 (CIA30) n=1 Tax=Actinokineospora diospyrosa TaxID=103728 RepID=A0ABT1IBN7_9PSEU|nr:hypothetical protein [Actinokineospora diospyrosa]MCP2270037.1 hypothetical protein [Actinokineospora diospyrosa]
MRIGSISGRAKTAFARTLAAFISVLALSLVGSPGVAQAADSGAGRGCECATPSIDRFQQWLASGEGTTVPATGSLLVREGRGHVAKIDFVNAEWHVFVVWLGNKFEAQADLTRSSGFWMTYSATDDLYVQLRPASQWSGGDKWLTLVPSTRGKVVRKFFPFTPDKWTWLPELGKPSHTFASALSEARGFVFVGKTANKLKFEGLRIDRYQPPCV